MNTDRIEELARRIPRTAVELSLRAARVPLDVAERVSDHRGDPGWPPALYFAGFEALVRKAAGAALADSQLARSGRLEEAAVLHEERADELDQQAAAVRERAAGRAAARGRAARQERDRRVRQAGQRAARGRQRATQVAAAETEAVEQEQRAAREAQISAEARALQADRTAVAAARDNARVDEALERSRSG